MMMNNARTMTAKEINIKAKTIELKMASNINKARTIIKGISSNAKTMTKGISIKNIMASVDPESRRMTENMGIKNTNAMTKGIRIKNVTTISESIGIGKEKATTKSVGIENAKVSNENEKTSESNAKMKILVVNAEVKTKTNDVTTIVGNEVLKDKCFTKSLLKKTKSEEANTTIISGTPFELCGQIEA